MSSFALSEGGGTVLGGWETNGQVSFERVDPASGRHGEPIPAPGPVGGRKHPAVAANGRGESILVWTDGMGWNRGGGLSWQVFGREGRPTGERGKTPGVPVW